MHTYAENPQPIVLAHRGGAAEASEHSLQAYQQAVAAGCDYLELDVRVDESGTLFLQHGRRPSGDHKPVLLEELFQAFPDKYFAIDPKHEAAVLPLADMIIRYRKIDQVCIGASVDARARTAVEYIEQTADARPALALVSAAAGARLLAQSYGLLPKRPIEHADFIHLHNRLVTRRVINTAHTVGVKLIAWTVNDPRRMEQLLGWGIDGFMTDVPSVAAPLLVKH